MLELDYDQVGSLMSELSEPSIIPKLEGRTRPPRSFDAEEIDFNTSEWLARVLEVAIWLNLDASFEDNAAPLDVAMHLFDELSPGKADTNFDLLDGVVGLTEIGAQALEERLTRKIHEAVGFGVLSAWAEGSIGARRT